MSEPGWPDEGGDGARDDELERRRDEFDEMVADAVAAIPRPYSEQLGSVAILTEDEPASGQQAPGTLLFGLYQGVPRTAWGATNAAIPSKITIFRRAHELAFDTYQDMFGLSRRLSDAFGDTVAARLPQGGARTGGGGTAGRPGPR